MNQTTADADSDIFARLATASPKLSRKMAQLGTFISQHHVSVAFMSARQLASAAGVSLATVVRFAGILGYRGYDELRAGIQDRVNIDLTAVERWRTLPINSRSSSGLLRRIINADIEAFHGLVRDFSEPQFEKFVRAVLDARRVTIFGFRYVAPLTTYFVYSLSKVRANVRGFTRGDSSLYDRVRLMDDGDVVVAIVFARYPRDVVELIRYAHAQGRRILTITDSPLSPILPLADVALVAKAVNLDFVGSLAAPAALINCLVSTIGARLGGKALRRLQMLEDAAATADIYVHAGSPREAARRRYASTR
ncbi:MAG TPA: MurR/RpiR family transcriptional regulator [bacterium]|nr:MurR/RpiR family transcriptional regulator [bacterium]